MFTVIEHRKGKSMERLAPIDESKLSSDQRRCCDQIKQRFGVVAVLFAVWLRNPDVAEHGLKLQEAFASRVQLERRLLELAVMVTARYFSAQFEWSVHKPYALKFGISPDISQAIRERHTPTFTREDERLVYDLAMELNMTRSLSDGNFQRGMDMFGEQVMVELVAGVGFYGMVAMTLNAFDVPTFDGKKQLA
jgi:4-carboxymuconolactone decarboxylase